MQNQSYFFSNSYFSQILILLTKDSECLSKVCYWNSKYSNSVQASAAVHFVHLETDLQCPEWQKIWFFYSQTWTENSVRNNVCSPIETFLHLIIQPAQAPQLFPQLWWGALGKHLWKCWAVYLSIAQIAIAPPPTPRTQTGTLGHFIFGPIWANLSNHRFDGTKVPQSILASLNTLLNKSKCPFELQFSLHKCPKPSWQAFWPPHNQANAHLN